MSDTHVELPGSARLAPHDSKRLGEVAEDTPVDATITLKGPDLPAPDQMPIGALSREEIKNRFGVPGETVEKVERSLQSYGLQLDEVTQYGRSLKIHGSAAAFASAFRAKLAIYKVPDLGKMRARHGKLWIPRELDGIVTGVFGLDQRRMARCHTHAAGGNGTASPLTPADLERRYNFPDGDCAGKTIAIAAFGQVLNDQVVAPAFIESDVISFCNDQRRPVPDIKTVNVGLSPLTRQQYNKLQQQLPPESARWKTLAGLTAETMMDAQIVAALCPKAKIRIYFATWGEGGWVDLLDAVTSGSEPVPVVVSISYGLAEDDPEWSPAALTAINERLQIAALLGITVCVAAGDGGSGCDQQDGGCHVQFPSSSPYVLSVGGTMLVPQQGGQHREVVWNDAGGVTGGGVSMSNPRAPWQSVQIQSRNSYAFDGRVLPDVSALAGPPLYSLLLDGAARHGGGTSAAAPLWASLIARIDAVLPEEKRQRFLTPLLYKPGVHRGFHDIDSGKNASSPPGIGYEAHAGFDAASGWGVPDGKRLLDALTTV